MIGKIHRATVTQADLHYVGSITIDEELLEAAGILPFERVEVYDITNGNRLATYALPGERNSGLRTLRRGRGPPPPTGGGASGRAEPDYRGAPRVTRRLKTYLELVRFEHTLFALPFAYVGMLLGARGWPGWEVFLWVTVAMVGARTAAMALNRLIDWQIDAQNPRTRNRHLPRGLVRPGEVLALALLGIALLALAAFNLNPLTARLLPVAVFFLAFYSYTKRFTWTCHYWLGLVIGAAAAGGWIAVTGRFEPATYLLWAAVGLWIAGFDILYATQDYASCPSHPLHCLALFPGRRARRRALALVLPRGALHRGGARLRTPAGPPRRPLQGGPRLLPGQRADQPRHAGLRRPRGTALGSAPPRARLPGGSGPRWAPAPP